MAKYGVMGRQYGGNNNDELESKIPLPPPITAQSKLGPGPTYVQSRAKQIASPPVPAKPPETPARPTFGVMGQKPIPQPPKRPNGLTMMFSPNARNEYWQEQFAYEDQQEALKRQQAQQIQYESTRQKFIDGGLSEQEATWAAMDPGTALSEMSKRFAPRDVTAGNSVWMNGKFHQAPQTIETEKDPYGRVIFADPNSQTVSEPHGDVKPEILSDGAQLRNPLTGEMVAENEKNFSPHAGVQVNLPSNKMETEYQKGLGQQSAQSRGAIIDSGVQANQNMGDISAMETALDMIDYTGFGGDTLLGMQRLGSLLGVEVGEDIAPKEVAQRLTAKMGLALKSDLPGPMSDGDRQFLISIPPNINMSPEANDAMLYIMRRRNEYAQEMAKSLYEANPQTAAEQMAWERNFRMNYGDMFSAEDRMELMSALSGAQ